MNSPAWSPPEPAGAQVALRRLAGEDPRAARVEIVTSLCEHLWPSLDGLAIAGPTPCLLAAVISELAYESWLWVMGDRTWEQFAEALAGRLDRRVVAHGPRSATAGS